jgi:SAM-dependent methyltransferase
MLLRVEGLQYVGADRDSPLADDRVDIRPLPYEDGRFGAVLCSHVLEHVDDDRRAMREMLRVLRAGGWAIIMAPVAHRREATLEDPSITDEAKRVHLFGQEDHVRIYGTDLADRLGEEGFSVRVEQLVEDLPTETVRRMRLDVEDDEIYFCTKPDGS